MSSVWPHDEHLRQLGKPPESIRPFKCLLLMPFEQRFDEIADLIKEIVEKVVKTSTGKFILDLPDIKRIDWVISTNAIQYEIWREIAEADLVFCDITGYNPNVLFEAGICAAWKRINQVVFIKDKFFKQQSVFDLAPIRYTEYELTSNGLPRFQEKVAKLTFDALIAFPDTQINTPPTAPLPLTIDFDAGDDLRIYTPPFAHRRVANGWLEFGSLVHYGHSWASIGREQFKNFHLEFLASATHSSNPNSFIGVSMRSHHYFANYGHTVYLGTDGRIVLTQPDDDKDPFYQDHERRGKTPIDATAEHFFRITFTDEVLDIAIDEWHERWDFTGKKTFGPGLIRLQSSLTRMRVRNITIKSG